MHTPCLVPRVDAYGTASLKVGPANSRLGTEEAFSTEPGRRKWGAKMSYLSGESLGDEARAAGNSSAPEVALPDPGAQRVLRLFTDSPSLTRAMNAVITAAAGSVHGNNSEMLAALPEVVDRCREVSAQLQLVHCQTPDRTRWPATDGPRSRLGRTGRQLSPGRRVAR